MPIHKLLLPALLLSSLVLASNTRKVHAQAMHDPPTNPPQTNPPGANAQEVHEFIFQPGSTSFPESHASTIVELNGGKPQNGDLMAAWFGGTRERDPDVAIWGSRHVNGTWTAPVELVREKNIACWNPVVFHTRDGRLWLYYKFGPSPSGWSAGRRYSQDEGETWSPVEHLPAGLLGPIRAKPLVLPDGTIVSGSSVEAYDTWAAWIERSTDNGRTWARIGPITVPSALDVPDPRLEGVHAGYDDSVPQAPDSTTVYKTKIYPPAKTTIGIIQPTIVPLGGTHLRLYARSHSRSARIAVADSFDLGSTWTQARFLDLPNPNSGIDAVRLRDGRIVLIYNNSSTTRTPLNLAVSADGEHFRMFKTLESTAGQFSYPAIIQSSDGSLRITYTWQRKTIKYVRLPLDQVPRR